MRIQAYAPEAGEKAREIVELAGRLKKQLAPGKIWPRRALLRIEPQRGDCLSAPVRSYQGSPGTSLPAGSLVLLDQDRPDAIIEEMVRARPRLYKLAKRLCQDPVETDDLVQDTFECGLRSYRGGGVAGSPAIDHRHPAAACPGGAQADARERTARR